MIDSTAGVEGSVLWGRVSMFIEGERETGGTASISFYQPVPRYNKLVQERISVLDVVSQSHPQVLLPDLPLHATITVTL